MIHFVRLRTICFRTAGSGPVHSSNLSCGKKIVFAGCRFAKISADSEDLKKRFDLPESKLPRDRNFSLCVKLTELKCAIAGSRQEDAEKIISELNTEIKKEQPGDL